MCRFHPQSDYVIDLSPLSADSHTEQLLTVIKKEVRKEGHLHSHLWQSRVEIEGYSVAYFDRIAAFEAPYR